jgi:hypothetical protein
MAKRQRIKVETMTYKLKDRQYNVSWGPVIRVLWTHSAIFSIIVLLSLLLGVFLLYEIGCDAWEDVFVN